MTEDIPRNEDLPLFNPHRTDFTCQIEATKVPAIDAQADQWFLMANAMENDPEILSDERNWKEIVRLTKQAADRQHWKAMLNLASLYLEGRDVMHGKEDAILIVENAIRLGVPAAYDRMGTYYINGIVEGGATRAYAFWQKAAEMGNPNAMTYLGDKLAATWDNPEELFWANIPVAIKMLECAFSQGNGEAAYHLHFEYAPSGEANAEQKSRALRILHEGVKLGCQPCASRLSIKFNGTENPEEDLAPFRDKSRSERYLNLSAALRFNPSRRFPNLDKVLPLPPASLPRWDGKRETLVNAAMAVTQFPIASLSDPVINGKGRAALDAAFVLQATGETTSSQTAPFASYWRPTAAHESAEVRAYLADLAPGLYATGEEFDPLPYPTTVNTYGTIRNVVWERMLTVPADRNAVVPRAAAGVLREVDQSQPGVSCPATKPCPVTGTWQPWLDAAHPLRHAVNQPWRQAWVTADQPFPDPHHDWLLNLDKADLSWHLLDSAPPNML